MGWQKQVVGVNCAPGGEMLELGRLVFKQYTVSQVILFMVVVVAGGAAGGHGSPSDSGGIIC